MRPVLADRLLLVEAELLRRTGGLQQAAELLTGLRGPATPHTAHALARLHLAAGDAAAAEQSLAPFPRCWAPCVSGWTAAFCAP